MSAEIFDLAAEREKRRQRRHGGYAIAGIAICVIAWWIIRSKPAASPLPASGAGAP